jgi:hypothetical protein
MGNDKSLGFTRRKMRRRRRKGGGGETPDILKSYMQMCDYYQW